jgi:hypothetical protein|nr:hypothetical protein [uncultured Pseudoxanthomonas sp.]
MKELNASEVQMVSGGTADFSDVTVTVTSTEQIVSTCKPGTSSAWGMPYYSFACTIR